MIDIKPKKVVSINEKFKDINNYGYFATDRELEEDEWTLLNFAYQFLENQSMKFSYNTLINDCKYFKDYTEEDIAKVIKKLAQVSFITRSYTSNNKVFKPLLWVGTITEGTIILLTRKENDHLVSSLVSKSVLSENPYGIYGIRLYMTAYYFVINSTDTGLAYTYDEAKKYFGITKSKYSDIEKELKKMFTKIDEDFYGNLSTETIIKPYLDNTNKEKGLAFYDNQDD